MQKASRDLNKLYETMREEEESLDADEPRDLNKLYETMREEEESLEADEPRESDKDFDEIKEAEDEVSRLEKVYYDHLEAMKGLMITRAPCSAHKVHFTIMNINSGVIWINNSDYY